MGRSVGHLRIGALFLPGPHAHFDHAAADRLPESASLLRLPGELRDRDLSVCGIRDIDSNPRGTLPDFPNVMYRLKAVGLRFLPNATLIIKGSWNQETDL